MARGYQLYGTASTYYIPGYLQMELATISTLIIYNGDIRVIKCWLINGGKDSIVAWKIEQIVVGFTKPAMVQSIVHSPGFVATCCYPTNNLLWAGPTKKIIIHEILNALKSAIALLQHTIMYTE